MRTQPKRFFIVTALLLACRGAALAQSSEACCLPDGTCDDLRTDECLAQGGTPHGPGSACPVTTTTSPGTIGCPAAEACCLVGDVCLDLVVDECLAQGGAPQGSGIDCTSDPCATPLAPAGNGADRVSATEKGSVLIFSDVEIRWDAAGNVVQDTFIDVTNDWVDGTGVQMYFVNGDPPLAAGAPAPPGPGGMERAHPGWNWVDVKIELTPNQPAWWSALTGSPGPGSSPVSPFTILDPSGDPLMQGRPAPDGSGDRVLRGVVYAWACDETGCQVSWNHLKGLATIVNYRDGAAWEYNAWTFQDANNLAPGVPVGACGEINLDGVDFVPPYAQLLLDFQSVGSTGFSGGSPIQTIGIDTDLTLHPVDVDLRQENHGPFTTKATITIWNENETQFTGLHRCITCWDQTLLSQYAPNANHFLMANLQTDKGKARIDGVASTLCSSNCCIAHDEHGGCADHGCQEMVCGVDSFCCAVEWDDDCVWIAIDLCDACDGANVATPLLGVAVKLLSFNGTPNAAAGFGLIGMGTEPTSVLYDPVTGGPGPPPNAP